MVTCDRMLVLNTYKGTSAAEDNWESSLNALVGLLYVDGFVGYCFGLVKGFLMDIFYDV